MSYLNGPLYSKVLRQVQGAKQTGSATHVMLVQQRVCLVRQRVCPPLIYHVGLVVADRNGRHHLLEHGPVKYDPLRPLESCYAAALPSVRNSIDEIIEFERSLPTEYILGIRDCRHHVLDILEYLYD